MKYIATLVFVLIALYNNAQQKATTDNGQRVILNDNGKWEYEKKDTAAKSDLKSFTKPAAATSLIRSEKNNYAVWYDPKKWKKRSDIKNDAVEFQLGLSSGDGYAMAVTERIEIAIENLKEVALTNAMNAAPDVVIEMEEDRMINGHKVKCLQMSGTASGIKFTYLGYYTSHENGTIQLVCFTGKNLMKQYRKDFEDLLNGLVLLEEEKKE